MTGDRGLEALREALQVSPENVPLRRALGEALLGIGRADEAQAAFREALAIAPDDVATKLGLAAAFLQGGKAGLAVVLVEDVVRRPDAPARAFVLHARILAGTGEVEEAVRQYRRGVELDPAAADSAFADRLGIRIRPRDADANPPYDPSGEGDDDEEEEDDEGEVVEGRVRASWEGPDDDEESGVTMERPAMTFADVGGMESVKDEIRIKIIHPLNHPGLYKAYGKSIGGGILLYGPPGCGKTHLARATAGEIQAGFLAVGIDDVLEMWIGNSERNLHGLFERARADAPSVLFFDEVDALAASRSDLKASGGRQLVNQFLAELDGVGQGNEGVLVLAATNAPWHLDSAFRRPGRFDRILFVPPPDLPARAAILRLHCRDKPVEDIDFEHLAKKTDGLSGADLKLVVDLAVEVKLREAMKAGIPKPLTTKDLLRAASGVKPSTREWFASARNHALYSNQGGIYDDILKYLKLG